MAPPTRTSLEAMKRVDIQRLCKDYGIRANLKTEALIDLLLDASQSESADWQYSAPARRTLSRAGSGRTSRSRSGRSFTGHETEVEVEDRGRVDKARATTERGYESEPMQVLSPRARKGKLRVGTGISTIATRSGARVATQSGSIPRSRIGRNNRRMAVDTIPEEESDSTQEPEYRAVVHSPTSPTSRLPPVPSTPTDNSLASLEQVDEHVAAALRPLHDQMTALKKEFARLKLQVAESEALKAKVNSLTKEVKGLKTKAANAEAEVERMRQSMSPQGFTLSTPIPRLPTRIRAPRSTWATRVPTEMPPEIEAEASTRSDGPGAVDRPEELSTVLGKRYHDFMSDEFVDKGREDGFSDSDRTKPVNRSSGKRRKLGVKEIEMDVGVEAQRCTILDGETTPVADGAKDVRVTPRAPHFTVFTEQSPTSTGPSSSQVDPPDPTERPPGLDTPNPSQPRTRRITSSANAAENAAQSAQSQANPFSFAFMPLPGTPVYPLAMSRSSFPFPERPTSPTPSGPAPRGGVDLFGFGHVGRPRSRADGRVAAASGSGATSNDVASGTGFTGARTSATDLGGSKAAPMVKKTMYGTEADVDTRFGDFGFEGVASGFWAGGRF